MKIEEFKEKYKNEDQIDHVLDFLKSEYGHKNSINFNYEQALKKANLWTQRLNEKNKETKHSGLVEIIKEFGNGFKIVRLIDQESKNWEGFHMGHCVASYTDHQGIYSLRDSKNIPNCTIEIKNDKIKQIKGKGNGRVSPKYVNYVLNFIQSLNLEFSNYDMENLGYSINVDIEFIKEHFSNYKIIKIKNREFLYVGNKLKLIKKFDSKSEELLEYFCQYNQSFDSVKLLVQNGANINAKKNWALLVEACLNGDQELIEFLIENIPEIPLSILNQYLRFASKNGHLDIVKFLVKKGANINDRERCNIYGIKENSLILASKRGHLNIVKFFVENGSDNFLNESSLHSASINGHLNIVKFLVENGTNIHSNDDYCLIMASYFGHFDIVDFLIKNGADISAQDNRAMFSARQKGHLKIVKLLIETNRKNVFLNFNHILVILFSIPYFYFVLFFYNVSKRITFY